MIIKKILIICGIALTLQICPALAQDAQIEARAAYMLAEESFSKGNYKNTLEYLQQVKASLGATNCKILYLEIMASNELYAKDENRIQKLWPLVDAFEKSPDYAGFNEDKRLEISKLKLAIKMELKAKQDAIDKELKAKQDAIDNRAKNRTPTHKSDFLAQVNFQGPFNVSIDELDKLHPKWKIKKWAIYKVSPTVDFYHIKELGYDSLNFPFPQMSAGRNYFNTIGGVYMKEGKAIGYVVITLHCALPFETGGGIYKINADYPGDASKTFTDRFYLEPLITKFAIPSTTASRYVWAEDKYGFMLEEFHYPSNGGGYAMNLQTYFYNTTSKPTISYHPSER